MKKVFTILLAVGTVGFASAQSNSQKGTWSQDHGNSKDAAFGRTASNNAYKANTGSYGSYSFSARERDAEIQKIRRQFDQKINAITRDRHLRAAQKAKQIRMLEKQRDEQIQQVQWRFSSSQNRHSDNHSNRNKW
jgi:hypothetical protein